MPEKNTAADAAKTTEILDATKTKAKPDVVEEIKPEPAKPKDWYQTTLAEIFEEKALPSPHTLEFLLPIVFAAMKSEDIGRLVYSVPVEELLQLVGPRLTAVHVTEIVSHVRPLASSGVAVVFDGQPIDIETLKALAELLDEANVKKIIELRGNGVELEFFKKMNVRPSTHIVIRKHVRCGTLKNLRADFEPFDLDGNPTVVKIEDLSQLTLEHLLASGCASRIGELESAPPARR